VVADLHTSPVITIDIQQKISLLMRCQDRGGRDAISSRAAIVFLAISTSAPPDGLYGKLERFNMLSDEDMNAGTRTRRQRQETKLARSRARNSGRSAVVVQGPPPSP
jgi:hypothetical protein